MTREEAVGILKFARSHAAYESDIAVLEMAISALQEQKTPCSACGYGGKHLDAPPCTTCPAHPKLESTSKLLESNGDRLRTLADEQMVAECIEREALLEDIENACVFSGRPDHQNPKQMGARLVVQRIRCAPAANVEPVVHGRWIEENGIQICSNCGEEHSWEEYRATYCEDCGARMDGE